MKDTTAPDVRRLAIAWRIAWTIMTLTTAQAVVCGISALPAVLIWSYLAHLTRPSELRDRAVRKFPSERPHPR